MFRSSFGRDVFLRSGLTCSCLKSSGNIPEHNDVFIIFVIGLISESRHAFNSVVGNGSRSHDLFGEEMIIFLTSSIVAGVKADCGEFICGGSTFT